MNLHPSARAFSGDAAVAYDAGRAAFSPPVVDGLGLPPGARVLDLGAGTGLLSTALRDAGFDVVAAEPMADMRVHLEAKLGADHVLDAIAEDLPLADASVDAVVAADAFHWFDPDAAATEIRRVLRPGGRCVLLWRWPAWSDAPAWHRRIGERLNALRGDHPAFVGEQGREGFGRIGGFTPFTYAEVPFVNAGSRDGVLANLRSISFVAALPQADRDALLADVDGDLRAAGIETFDEPYVVKLWATTRR